MDSRLHFRELPARGVRLPAGGEVHVWFVDLDAAGSPPLPHDLLSEDELDRGQRFHFERDRRRFMAARGALRTRLGSYLLCAPQDLRFAYGAHGKPSLSAPSSTLRFNLSHAGGRALLGFTVDREIGIDIERLTPVPDALDLAARFFAPTEWNALAGLDPVRRDRAFLRGWTCKEAFVKARGEGLGFPLDRFAVSLAPDEPTGLLALEGDDPAAWSLVGFEPEAGFLAAVAVHGPESQVTVWGAPAGLAPETAALALGRPRERATA